MSSFNVFFDLGAPLGGYGAGALIDAGGFGLGLGATAALAAAGGGALLVTTARDGRRPPGGLSGLRRATGPATPTPSPPDAPAPPTGAGARPAASPAPERGSAAQPARRAGRTSSARSRWFSSM
jgi:hypothetical protein